MWPTFVVCVTCALKGRHSHECFKSKSMFARTPSDFPFFAATSCASVNVSPLIVTVTSAGVRGAPLGFSALGAASPPAPPSVALSDTPPAAASVDGLAAAFVALPLVAPTAGFELPPPKSLQRPRTLPPERKPREELSTSPVAAAVTDTAGSEDVVATGTAAAGATASASDAVTTETGSVAGADVGVGVGEAAAAPPSTASADSVAGAIDGATGNSASPS